MNRLAELQAATSRRGAAASTTSRTSGTGAASSQRGGRSGKAGSIDKMLLVNFLVHEKFEIQFGTNQNFVTGVNGSGKSAIMSAIIIVLGGRARTTMRGDDLGALVRDGQQHGSITVWLSNRGTNAYQPEKYGDQVEIQRKLTKLGGKSQYLVLQHGKMTNLKKADLDRILEHFKIKIENPFVVMNQDLTKTMMTKTTPKQLFDYFMDATLLSDLKQGYEDCGVAITNLDTTLMTKNDMLKVQQEERDKLRKERERENQYVEKKQELDVLQMKMTKAHVDWAKDDWAKCCSEAADAEAREKEQAQKLQTIEQERAKVKAAIEEPQALLSKVTDASNDAKRKYDEARTALAEATKDKRRLEGAAARFKRDEDGAAESLRANAERMRKVRLVTEPFAPLALRRRRVLRVPFLPYPQCTRRRGPMYSASMTGARRVRGGAAEEASKGVADQRKAGGAGAREGPAPIRARPDAHVCTHAD
jgi:chromosome segregation ATPase